MSISAIINTKNSVKTLERALSSLQFVDEIIVVDMQSTDGTPELAKQLGASVFFHTDMGYVEPARQFAIEKATSTWVLVLDADEAIPPKLASTLLELAESDHEPVAYAIPRKNRIFGYWLKHTGWWPDYQIRFFRKGSLLWPDTIHSVPKVSGEVIELPARFDTAIEHYNYNSISEYIQRLDRYTTVQAKSDGAIDTALSGKKIIASFRKEFLRRSFSDKGLQDGSHGIALSLLQGLSETVRLLKRWELGGAKPHQTTSEDLAALAELRSELAYWVANTQVERTSGVKKLWWQLRRRFQV